MNNMRFYKVVDGTLHVATITIGQPNLRNAFVVAKGQLPHRVAAIKLARTKGFLPKEEIKPTTLLKKLPRTYVKVNFHE